MTTNELVPASDDSYAITKPSEADVGEIFRANVGEGGLTSHFDLDRIKIPAGGGTTWEIPTLDGVKESKELDGIVVAWRDVRAYWEEQFGEGEEGPPQCSSNDMKWGHGTPGGPCAQCPQAAWGSDPKGGKGQACKSMRLVFLVQQDTILPVVLALPPTSLKGARKFFLRLAGRNVPFWGVVTRWTLQQEKGPGSVKYSIATPNIQRQLEPGELERVTKYVNDIKASLAEVKVDLEA